MTQSQKFDPQYHEALITTLGALNIFELTIEQVLAAKKIAYSMTKDGREAAFNWTQHTSITAKLDHQHARLTTNPKEKSDLLIVANYAYGRALRHADVNSDIQGYYDAALEEYRAIQPTNGKIDLGSGPK